MYSSKFIVSLVLVMHFNLSPLTGLGLDRHEIEDKNSGTTSQSLVANRTLDRMQRKQNETKNDHKVDNVNDDDDEFHFLVTGGYRPETNVLVKFVVSLRAKKERKFFGDNHFCGGAIISKKAILTAAHCLYLGTVKQRAQNVKVVAGTPRRLLRTGNTQILAVDKVRPHPRYNYKRLTNDIGLLKLKDEIQLNGGFVDIIPLADSPPEPGTQCTVVGWGTIIQYGPTPDEALNGDMTIRENSYCLRQPGFAKGQLCANDLNDYEVDSCQGDSGGPLMCLGKVVGIVSYGSGCGEPNSAGVYSDVNYYRKWILQNAAATHHHHHHHHQSLIYRLMQLQLLLLLILMTIKLSMNTI